MFFLPSSTTIVAVILTAIVTSTIIGNVFVIAAILIDKTLRASSGNNLILSLACADLLIGIVVMPYAAAYHVSHKWTFGVIVCDIWTAADVFCCTASILNLLAIAVDRYLAVTRVDYIYARTKTKINIMIVLSWTMASVVSLAPIFGWKDEKFNARVDLEQRCLLSQNVGYQLFATISTYYAPLVILLLLYWRIFQVARERIRLRVARNDVHQKLALANSSPAQANPNLNPNPNPNSNLNLNPSTLPICNASSRSSCTIVDDINKQLNDNNIVKLQTSGSTKTTNAINSLDSKSQQHYVTQNSANYNFNQSNSKCLATNVLPPTSTAQTTSQLKPNSNSQLHTNDGQQQRLKTETQMQKQLATDKIGAEAKLEAQVDVKVGAEAEAEVEVEVEVEVDAKTGASLDNNTTRVQTTTHATPAAAHNGLGEAVLATLGKLQHNSTTTPSAFALRRLDLLQPEVTRQDSQVSSKLPSEQQTNAETNSQLGLVAQLATVGPMHKSRDIQRKFKALGQLIGFVQTSAARQTDGYENSDPDDDHDAEFIDSEDIRSVCSVDVSICMINKTLNAKVAANRDDDDLETTCNDHSNKQQNNTQASKLTNWRRAKVTSLAGAGFAPATPSIGTNTGLRHAHDVPRCALLQLSHVHANTRAHAQQTSPNHQQTPRNSLQTKPKPRYKPKSRIKKPQACDVRRERRAARILALVSGSFVLCWLPFFVMALAMALCSSCAPSELLLSTLQWLGYCNSLLNPIIYTVFSPDFRAAFRRLACLSPN